MGLKGVDALPFGKLEGESHDDRECDGTDQAEQFLWGVQTLLLLFANHHAHNPEVRDNPSAVTATSAAGNVVTVHMALVASTRIPANMDASDAIHAFHFAYVHKPTDDGSPEIPAWLQNLD